MARLIRKTHFERFDEQRTKVAKDVSRILAANETADGALEASMREAQGANYLVAGAALEAVIQREIERLGDGVPFKRVADAMQKTRLHPLVTAAARGNPSEVSTSYMQQWQLLNFRKAGEKVYEVSPGLASRASKTELRGITTDLLLSPSTMPYPAVYLMVPPEAELFVENVDSGTHPVEGIYISKDAGTDGTPGWRLMVVGTPKKNIYDDALFHFIMPLPQGVSLDEAIDKEMLRARTQSPGYFNDAEMKCLDLMPALFRWAMNIVIYATSADARRQDVWNHPDAEGLQDRARKHPKGSHKGDRARDQLKAANLRKRVYLGAGIAVLGTGTDTVPGQSAHAKPGLIVRTLVQGHWRNQAHGPAHALRKLIWISPFWRGPEDGEVSNPVHKLS